MSHFDAPLRSRRHSDPPTIDSIRRRHISTANDTDDHHTLDAPGDEPLSARPRVATAQAPLKALLLPAQLELRRLAARQSDVFALRSRHPSGPRLYATDSTFRLHALVARQSTGSTGSTSAALEEAAGSVDASTDCSALADAYSGTLSSGQVVAACARRQAVIQAESIASSSSAAAASTSRAVASSSRAAASSSRSAAAASSSRAASASSSRSSAAAAARSTTSVRMSTTTRPAATPRIAAPITTSLNPSQASSSRLAALESFVNSQFSDAASVISSRAAVASSSRAALQSGVDSLFSSALAEVSSLRASASATAFSTTPSTSASASSSTSASSSSALSSLPLSSSSSTSSLPTSTSSGSDPSATTALASGSNNNRIAKIVGPSVAVPLGLLLLALLAFLFWRRRRRRAATGPMSGRSTPGIGPISNPRPMQAAPRQYGAMAHYAPTGAGYGGPAGGSAGAGAGMASAGVGGLAAAAAAGTAVGAVRGNNNSQESVGTTPSAIGLALSEPRSKSGRRSPAGIFAGGARGPHSGTGSPADSAAGGGQYRGMSGTSSFGGRQPSITSLASGSIPSEYRGVGGYNSFGYQPGQMRPVMTPLGAHYDPFGPSASIVPVPVSAQRHPHPVPSEEGSISGYDSGSGEDGAPRRYVPRTLSSGSESIESTATRPGYPYLAPVHGGVGQSRTTQTTGEDGYYTADPGISSYDEHETETLEEAGLRDFGVQDSPEEASVNFGSGSSGSGSAGRPSFVGSMRGGSVDDPGATPRVGSRTSTPRLGTGHGSLGNRRNDGTGSWWN